MPGEGLTHGPPATRKQAAVTTGPAEHPGIPCAMVLTLIRALLGDRLSCPRRPRDRQKQRELSASTATPGPYDFTSASMLFVRSRNARCSTDTSTASRAQRS